MASGKRERDRLLTYIICGGIVTLTAAGVFFLVFWLTENRHVALALDYVWGTAIGYLLNRYLTFDDRSVPTAESFTKYCFAAVGYFVLHWSLLEVMVRGLVMNVLLAFILSFVAAFAAFYSAQKIWVFKHNPA